jgi:hypothetical protein
MGRIPQLFGHTVLAASMLAGGAALLNAGGAQAASFAECASDSTAVFGNSGSFNLTNGVITNVGSPQCDTTSVIQDRVTIDGDFTQVPGNKLLGPSSGMYTYTLTTTTPGYWFSDARVDSDVDDPGNVTLRKQIYSDVAMTNLIWDNTSTDGSAVGFLPIPNQYSTIYVKDTWNIPSNSTSIDTFTNTFNQTPGPLPILGAGAAFGFSRKLRGRIKAARLG